MVQGRRPYPEANLSGSGCGKGSLFEPHHLGSPVLVEHGRAHRRHGHSLVAVEGSRHHGAECDPDRCAESRRSVILDVVNTADPAAPQPAEPTPDAPDETDIHGSPDATLGGYFRVHDRPPGFEGADGQPYTVSIEVERTSDLRAPWEGFLVFPRWAETGLGIVGHVETPTLWTGAEREQVLRAAGETPLLQVQLWLDEAIASSAPDA